MLPLLLAATASHGCVVRPNTLLGQAARPLRPRTTAAVLRYEDDPWLSSSAASPLSSESLDVLFRYGPVVYGARLSTEEYNASVRDFMNKNKAISRALAEQEIHEYIADGTGYLARTQARDYKGPREEDIKPPVGLGDRVLVIAWVVVLVPAASILFNLCLNAPEVMRSSMDTIDMSF